VKTVATHGRAGRTEQGVLQKGGLGIAELLQPAGHACPARYEPHLRIALSVLVFEPLAEIHQAAAFGVYWQSPCGMRLQGRAHACIGSKLRAKMFWEATAEPDGIDARG
jgi:hypothetical protein